MRTDALNYSRCRDACLVKQDPAKCSPAPADRGIQADLLRLDAQYLELHREELRLPLICRGRGFASGKAPQQS